MEIKTATLTKEVKQKNKAGSYYFAHGLVGCSINLFYFNYCTTYDDWLPEEKTSFIDIGSIDSYNNPLHKH